MKTSGELFAQQQEDYVWFHRQEELRRQYADQVVVLHNRELIGSGPDAVKALEDAERAMKHQNRAFPKAEELAIFPVLPPVDWNDPRYDHLFSPTATPRTNV